MGRDRTRLERLEQLSSTGPIGPQGATGPSGHGSTTTTAAPTLVSGNWRFTVADTTAFNAFGLPIYCGDGTNSIRGTVYNVLSSTQIDITPVSSIGTVSSITNGSTFTFSGVAGPAGPTGPAGGSSGTVPLASSFTYLGAAPNATAADKVGRMVITIPSGATHPQEFLQTLPATPYTIDVWCEQIGAKPASLDAFGAGIGISDGIKIISFGIAIFSAGTKASVDTWSSTTAHNSQPFSDNSWPISGLIRLRLTDDGTTRKYYTSTNGLDFINVYSEATNTYLTPTKGGIHTYNNSSTSVASKVAVLNFVITNSVLGDAS